MPRVGQPLDRRPAVLARASPRGTARPRSRRPAGRRLDRGQQRRAGARRSAPSARRRGRRRPGRRASARCTGPGTIIPACLRTSSSRADQGRVAGDEGRRGSRRGSTASTASRRASRPSCEPPRDPRVEDRGGRRRLARPGRAAPVELGVALVARPRRRRAARAQRHHLREVLDAEHLAGGVAGSVEPDQLRRRRGRRRPERGERVDRHRRRPGEPRADVVGRVGDPREGDDVARRRGPAAAAARRRAPWSRSSAAPRRGRRRARRGGAANQVATASRRSAVPQVSG